MTPLLGDDADGVEEQREIDNDRPGNQKSTHL
jgi:hypothetical protein